MSMIKAIISGVFWGISLYKCGKGEYEGGYKYILLSEKFRGSPDAEMLLLKGFLLAVLGHESEAETMFELAATRIKSSVKLNRDEKRYLLNYGVSMLRKIKDDEEYGEIDREFDLDNVRKHLLENHPLKID